MGAFLMILAIIAIVIFSIFLPAWILQFVLGAFGVDVNIWICILILVLINLIAGMFKNNG